jgi:hypothetical protein
MRGNLSLDEKATQRLRKQLGSAARKAKSTPAKGKRKAK